MRVVLFATRPGSSGTFYCVEICVEIVADDLSTGAPEPGTTCLRCHVECGENLRAVPYAMDVWAQDVPALGAVAGEAVWFCEAVCDDCAPLVGTSFGEAP